MAPSHFCIRCPTWKPYAAPSRVLQSSSVACLLRRLVSPLSLLAPRDSASIPPHHSTSCYSSRDLRDLAPRGGHWSGGTHPDCARRHPWQPRPGRGVQVAAGPQSRCHPAAPPGPSSQQARPPSLRWGPGRPSAPPARFFPEGSSLGPLLPRLVEKDGRLLVSSARSPRARGGGGVRGWCGAPRFVATRRQKLRARVSARLRDAQPAPAAPTAQAFPAGGRRESLAKAGVPASASWPAGFGSGRPTLPPRLGWGSLA